MQKIDLSHRALHFSGLKRKINKRLKKYWKTSWQFQPLSDAINKGRVEFVEDICSTETIAFPPAQIWNLPRPVASTAEAVNYPAVTLTRVHNASVIGATNFILLDGKLVHPDAYIPSRDRSPIELYGQAAINADYTALRFGPGFSHGTVERAINLCDQTHNYAHWMTEVLPKIALVGPRFHNYDILVDEGIDLNYFEAIKAAFPNASRIISVPRFSTLQVKDLVVVSPTAYCPHEFRDYDSAIKAGFEFYFSRQALITLRKQLRRCFSRYANRRARNVYIQRTPFIWTWNNRNIENIDEIEDVVDSYGFDLINVGGMTFAQQAKIFMNVRSIVAPTGAALANMIFAEPGCKIVVLSSHYQGANYDYFHRLASTLGHVISFVTGPQTKNTGNPMNRDYVINPDDLKTALNKSNHINKS